MENEKYNLRGKCEFHGRCVAYNTRDFLCETLAGGDCLIRYLSDLSELEKGKKLRRHKDIK